MFKTIYFHELTYWLKRPSSYIYFVVFFIIAGISFAGTAGYFDPTPATKSMQSMLNSPLGINKIFQYFNKIFLFLLPAIIGASIYRDYQNNCHSIVYTFPIKKIDYLLAKLLASLTVVLVITTALGLALIIAENLPGLNSNIVGDYGIFRYVQAYGLFTIPNVVAYGLVVFALVMRFRNIYSGFGFIILLVFIQIITQNAFAGHDYFIALFDPFGQNTVGYLTQFWSVSEQNIQFIPLWGVLLWNRIMWLMISVAIFLIVYRKFSFSQSVTPLFARTIQGKPLLKNNFESRIKVTLPRIKHHFSFLQSVNIIWRMSINHFNYIIKNWMFMTIVILGLLSVVFSLARVTNKASMALLPETSIVLAVPSMFFTGVIILLTFLYTGMLVRRDLAANMNQLVDICPVSNAVQVTSRMMAIFKMQLVLLLVLLISGVSLQLYNGFYQLELGLYFFHLFVLSFSSLIIWACISMFVHIIIENLYVGLFILVMFWIGIGMLPEIGIRSYLLNFNSNLDLNYSAINGYDNNLPAYFLIRSYWLVVSLVALILGFLLYKRGFTFSFGERFTAATLRFTKPLKIFIVALCVLIGILGMTIFKEERKAIHPSDKLQQLTFKKFQQSFNKYDGLVQPKIISMKVNLDLYPEKNAFEASGSYFIKNKTNRVIDTLLIKTGFDEVTEFSLSLPFEIIEQDDYVKFYVLKLSSPMNPEDSIDLSFHIKNESNTLFEQNSNVLRNGTFLKADIFPRLGYTLSSDYPIPSNNNVFSHHYYAQDSDRLYYEMRISTSMDQSVVVPGYLINSEEKNGRLYQTYRMDRKIKYNLNINSADFTETRDQWNNIGLSIHHHEDHVHNLSNMMEGMKASLQYNTEAFTPYQYRDVKVVEFPKSQGSYATMMGNCMPTSELRFIANTDSTSDKIDLTFYVMAHELTHQWWGNQLMPAYAAGATMLTESITEYITLRIYEQQFGEKRALQFLKSQRQRYLRGRTNELNTEPPLFLVKPPQDYIAYGKGAMAFNALSQMLGPDKLNVILRSFLLRYQYKDGHYPSTLELLALLKVQSPDSLNYLIEDLFEHVTFYDNKINVARVLERENGQYELTIDLNINKTHEVSGEQIEVELNDYVEIACYEDEQLVAKKTILINSENTSFTWLVDSNVNRVLLDPRYLLMDKNMKDNEMAITN